MSHALLSPSSSHCWLKCVASVAMTKDMPDETSEYAEEGTKAHRLAELYCIKSFEGQGRIVKARQRTEEERAEFWDLWNSADEEMQTSVIEYVKHIQHAVSHCVDPLDLIEFEHPVDVSFVTGEDGAHGTVDCFYKCGDVLGVVDLKYGRGVEVSAKDNPQLMIYALGLLSELDPFDEGKIRQVVLHIVQPRIGNFSTWHTFVGDKTAGFQDIVTARGGRALELVRGESQPTAKDFYPEDRVCRFCRAKVKCPALHKTLSEGFPLIPEEKIDPETRVPFEIPLPIEPEGLAKAYGYLPLIEQWCEAVRAEAIRRLSIGAEVPGYKLVPGRQGIRRWGDAKEAERLLKSMKVPDALRYEKKLISPTAAQKLTKSSGEDKPVLSMRQWAKLDALVTRNEGKPTVVPESDPRPALLKGENFKQIKE